MKIADDVYVLPIPRGSREAQSFLNLTLVLDDENGNTLVDTGLPGQAEAIGSALGEAGVGVRDLRHIIFTHQDLDHVGSGAALVRQSGARVLAHPADAPYIEGELRPLKVTPQMLERRPQMREVLERLEPVRLDEHLEDGDLLDLVGGRGASERSEPVYDLDVGEATRSVRRLAELDMEAIVCYHGGVVGEDVNAQLRRVIQELSQEGED
jgi:glyoxylase-like metal-dependent hydrolase (beta-lactamase superfamily II)